MTEQSTVVEEEKQQQVDEEGTMEVRNLSYICSTYVEMASPIKPQSTIDDEIELFFAIVNGPGNETYVYPKDRKVKGDEIATEVKKQGNLLFIEKEYEQAIGYYTIATRYAVSHGVIGDSIGHRSACFEKLGNNVAAYHDCKAALLFGFGNDNEVKRVKLEERKNVCEERLGKEALEKVEANREFVDTYEGKELFDETLIEVKYTEEKGQHVVAKVDIPKGTLIIEERAEFYSSLAYGQSFAGYCLCCLVKAKHPGGFIPCEYCPVGMYCSERCRQNHQVPHSLECGYMTLLQSFPDAGMLLQAVVKDTTYLTREKEPRATKFPCTSGHKYQQSYCDVDLIMTWKDGSSSEESTNVQARRHIALCYHILSFLNKCLGYELEISKRTIKRTLELFMINTLNQLGVGDGVIRLFPNVSLINHAKKRNTLYLSGGHWLKVHTTEDLAPGDEITTNYSVEENDDKRRNELKEKYGFDE